MHELSHDISFTIKSMSVGDINIIMHSVTLRLWIKSVAKPVSDALA